KHRLREDAGQRNLGLGDGHVQLLGGQLEVGRAHLGEVLLEAHRRVVNAGRGPGQEAQKQQGWPHASFSTGCGVATAAGWRFWTHRSTTSYRTGSTSRVRRMAET